MKSLISRRNYPNSALSLPLLGFGMMRLPRINPERPEIDETVAEKMVARAMECGINYFDTAYPYHAGLSEIFVGKALKKYPRDSFFLATKMWPELLKKPGDLERIFAEQLKKCQVDYFDFYLMHALDKRLYETAKKFHVYEFLQKQKAAGVIKHLGFSFHDTPEVLQEIVDDHDWDFAQIQLNYLDYELYRSREQYEILAAAKIPVIVMEPLRGSALAKLNPECTKIFHRANPDCSNAAWALRYAASFPGVITVLSGMTLPEHLEDNLKVFTDFKPLSNEERKVIDEVVKVYQNSGIVRCTNCRYCLPCPCGVKIPMIFSAYNGYIVSGDDYRRRFGRIYSGFVKEKADASHCINCKVCVKKCPQKIEIPETLKKIDAEYQTKGQEVDFNWGIDKANVKP